MKKLKSVSSLFLILCSPLFLRAQSSQYYPLGIEEMFELADKNSRSIRTFDLSEQEAGQAIKVAKNAKLPTVDASLSVSYLGDGWMSDRNFSNSLNAPMPHFGNNFAIEASQVIYAGGAISNNIAIAKLQQQLAQLDKENNRQEIRFLLVGNYLELYQLQNQAEVYAQNIGQTKRLLSDIQARQKEGLALKNDITRYELQLKSLELVQTQIENSKIILNNQLVTVLNLPQGTVIAIDTNILDKLPQTISETHWREKANTTSPALKQVHLGIEVSEYKEKIARADRLPSIAIFAGDRFDGPIIIEVPPIDKNFNYWYAGLGLKFNLASLYKSKKNIHLAELSTEKARISELLAKENIQMAIKAAYIRFSEAFTTYETQLKSLELAGQNYDIIHKRYLNELALVTDMLDASNAKLSAELQAVNARINILFNYYKLQKTIGNL